MKVKKVVQPKIAPVKGKVFYAREHQIWPAHRHFLKVEAGVDLGDEYMTVALG